VKLSEFLEQQAKLKDSGGAGGQQAPVPAKKPLRVLRTKPTPNPDALQYVLNAQVLAYGKKTFSSKDECRGDKLGEALFDIQGVRNVYVMDNFLTVTKDEAVDWSPLSSQVWKCIDTHVAIYPPDENEKPPVIDTANYLSLSHEQRLQAIELVLNRSVRANLARDGGGVELKGLEGNDVSVRYQGACGNCASSTTGTLKFIEQLLQQQLHPDLKVKPV
jgi:Fe-S cluster biogenesis protein NfuA